MGRREGMQQASEGPDESKGEPGAHLGGLTRASELMVFHGMVVYLPEMLFLPGKIRIKSFHRSFVNQNQKVAKSHHLASTVPSLTVRNNFNP